MKFDEPEESGGNRCYPKDVVNHLLLVWAIDYIAHSPTKFSRPDKPSDVIIVDCVDLDQVNEETGQPGLLATKAWWRQAKLIASLKPRVGGQDPMLVRMVKGISSMGMNAPFELVSMTSDPGCVNRAQAWFTLNPGFKPSVPSLPGGPPFEQSPESPASHWDTPESEYAVPTQAETPLERMARQSVQNQARTGSPMPPARPTYTIPEDPQF